MQVILLEKIKNLGLLGQQVTVKPGYGRNYLIPQGKAAIATPENIKEFEERRVEFEQAQNEALAYAQQRANLLEEMIVEITGKVGMENKLYGSVTAADIAQALTQGGVEVGKREIRLPGGPIRHVGKYEIAVHLHADVHASVTVQVVCED
jgi:large subunit ribosomal protein L9